MSDDDTEYLMEKFIEGKKLTDQEKSKLIRAWWRNSKVVKTLLWVVTIAASGLILLLVNKLG